MVKITVTVKPNSKEEDVERTGEKTFAVRVKAPAKEGRANDAVIRILSEYLGIAKSRMNIALGRSGKVKVIDIS